MRIEILHEFACLAGTLNFNATAKRCYISQSTLSKHIFSLEKELGCRLFVRNSQQVQLTPIGEALYRNVGDVLDAYDKCVDVIKQMKRDTRAILNIGYLYGASSIFITEILNTFAERNPDIDVSLNRGQGEMLRQSLQDGAFDLVFDMDIGYVDSTAYEKLSLYEDCYGVLFTDTHPLASPDGVTLDALVGETFLIPSLKQYETRSTFLQHALADELGENAKFEAILSDPTELSIYVKRGDGVGLVPLHALRTVDLAGMTFAPVLEPRLCFDVCAIWKKTDETPTLQDFIKVIQEVMQNPALIVSLSSVTYA